ncbi:MAG: hypothetical protein JO130_00845 [Solirubrobacterales bacterium]|nr:hypothetical protein [Solirubrobacterales bacterium]
MRRRLALTFVALLGLSACGGSTQHSTTTRTTAADAERTRLLSSLRTSLDAPTSPLANVEDLDNCIVQQAKALPLASLRTLASASVNTEVTDPLLARCVEQGKGLAFVRGVMADIVSGKLPPPVPAAFTSCVVAGVDKLTSAQLALALNQSATGSQTATRQIGERISVACIEEPPVFAQWRKELIGEIRHVLNGHHLPASYVNCVLGKAGQIRPQQLVKLAQSSSAAETAYGQELSHECRAAVGG